MTAWTVVSNPDAFSSGQVNGATIKGVSYSLHKGGGKAWAMRIRPGRAEVAQLSKVWRTAQQQWNMILIEARK